MSTQSYISIRSASDNQIKLDGQLVDSHTRCKHYHSQLDIIAIKFKCCNIYFPCYKCHLEDKSAMNHSLQKWTSADLASELVILCGECYHELLFGEYTSNGFKCIYCHSGFNPSCSLHYNLYFNL